MIEPMRDRNNGMPRAALSTMAIEALPALTRLTVALPAILAILFGLLLLYGTGFAGADLLHNAAHDARHGLAFPCH